MTTGGNVLINCVGGTAARLPPDEGTRGMRGWSYA